MNWAIFPSGNAEAARVCAAAWRNAGWRVGVLLDEATDIPDADIIFGDREYKGTAWAFNLMLDRLRDSEWSVVACVNDDMFPVNCSSVQSETRMHKHFGGTAGIIQPTGCWMDAMAWCAPCPLIGRDYCELHDWRPWHEGYYHLHCDEELKEVAERAGMYRTDDTLSIVHRHRSLGHPDLLPTDKRRRNDERGIADKSLFLRRKAAGFPR